MALRCAPIHACRPHALCRRWPLSAHTSTARGGPIASRARPPHSQAVLTTWERQAQHNTGAEMPLRCAPIHTCRPHALCRRWPLSAHTSMHEAARSRVAHDLLIARPS
eukprot:scaffold23477_cov60-Phaeocystis_antarctica.AAC.2